MSRRTLLRWAAIVACASGLALGAAWHWRWATPTVVLLGAVVASKIVVTAMATRHVRKGR